MADPKSKYADPFDLDKFTEQFAAGVQEQAKRDAKLPKVHGKGEAIEEMPDDSHLDPLDAPMRRRSNGRGYAR